jgi:hypothetical protein
VTRTWTGTARAFTRVYLPGDADVSVTASLCEEFFCTSDTEHKTVRLRR